jgi:hypothetical protein
MTGVAGLRRAGLSRADRGGLKPGDELTVIALAARDGSNSGSAQELKMADGRDFKLLADAPDAPPQPAAESARGLHASEQPNHARPRLSVSPAQRSSLRRCTAWPRTVNAPPKPPVQTPRAPDGHPI